MRIAFRPACALTLALVQLSSPALAQTGSPPAPRPADTLPPEPETQPGEAAPRQLDQASPPREYPLSMRILQINLSPYQVTRAGFEVEDLQKAVAGSPRAEELIRDGQSQLKTGGFIGLTGLVVMLGTVVVAVVFAVSTPNPTQSQSTAYGVTLSVGLLVGLVVTLVGGGIASAGLHKVTLGINAYNADLLDGRLVNPAALAVPPR